MSLLRRILLAMALTAGVTGAMVMAPAPAHAAIFEVYGVAYPTAAAAEAVRVMFFPTAADGRPTFVAFKPTGSNGPGFYIVEAVGS